MTKSAEQLFSESIDYSGLLAHDAPPLNEALREFTRLHNSNDKWMLSHFLVPYRFLKDLSKYSDRRERIKGLFNLCISGPQVSTLHEFKQSVLSIEKDILGVHTDFPGEARTNLLELMLPQKSVESLNPTELVKALEAVVTTSADSRLLPHRVYFQIDDEDFEVDVAKKIIKVIAVHNKSILKRKIDNYLFSGFKVNCGTKEEGKFPPPEYLAEIILYARDANVAIKFGGDVRQTMPSYDYDKGYHAPGLLNLMMAGVLAYTQDLNTEETVQVLTENNPLSFVFNENYLAWKELAAPAMEIKMLRMLSITSMNLANIDESMSVLKERGILA